MNPNNERTYLKFDTSKPDMRCLQCKAHNYLIFDIMPARYGIGALHTNLYKKMMDVKTGNWIHWWILDPDQIDTRTLAAWVVDYPNFSQFSSPICLKSYKEFKI